ncbi:hypothetical protein C5167_041201, partial [Papaver somniferum]
DHAKDIVNNPEIFSDDEKINTFLSFHKDTCVNILLLLYPSIDDDAFNDLEILKSFKPVLVGVDSELRRTYLDARYCDDDYDEEQRIRSVERGKQDALAMLQMLEVDMSKYQQDSDGDPKFIDDQPTQAMIDQYRLLEDEVTRTYDKMTELFENSHPIALYLSIVKHHVEDM